MLNWKVAAKGQRVELRKWRSGEYFLHPTRATEAQREAYRRPWWSNNSHTCIMCGEPLTVRQYHNSNVCSSCWQQECGK